jgi:hypothetical protein
MMSYLGWFLRAVRFLLYFIGLLLRSNIEVGKDIVTPGSRMAAGIRRVPLRSRTDLEITMFASGVDAATTAEILDLLTVANRNFYASSELLMRMGLLVGILTLGILALRAVVERRRSIGIARAIGLRRRQILAGMLVEALVAVSIGVTVGLVARVARGRPQQGPGGCFSQVSLARQ